MVAGSQDTDLTAPVWEVEAVEGRRRGIDNMTVVPRPAGPLMSSQPPSAHAFHHAANAEGCRLDQVAGRKSRAVVTHLGVTLVEVANSSVSTRVA